MAVIVTPGAAVSEFTVNIEATLLFEPVSLNAPEGTVTVVGLLLTV